MKISPCFNVGGFWYEPRGDWFSFGKVRKLCFLCSCKQTRETSISQMRARHIRPPSSAGTACMYQDSQQKWEKKSLLCLKYGYSSYKSAWIRYRRPLFTTRSRVRHVLLWMRASVGRYGHFSYRHIASLWDRRYTILSCMGGWGQERDSLYLS